MKKASFIALSFMMLGTLQAQKADTLSKEQQPSDSISNQHHSMDITFLPPSDGKLRFIIFSIADPSQSEDFIQFTEKYGVEFWVREDNIDPVSFEQAVENNKKIIALLTEKYGENWKKELPVAVFGLEKQEETI